VSSIAVLEHLIDDNRAIAEISRVIKDRGKLFITVSNAYKRILPLFWLISYFHDKRVGHLRHYSEKELKGGLLQNFKPKGR
jgi:ubiquinone/menaquinone biosynthesis C-methylase UbiE